MRENESDEFEAHINARKQEAKEEGSQANKRVNATVMPTIAVLNNISSTPPIP